jgi:hypothetical protein
LTQMLTRITPPWAWSVTNPLHHLTLTLGADLRLHTREIHPFDKLHQACSCTLPSIALYRPWSVCQVSKRRRAASKDAPILIKTRLRRPRWPKESGRGHGVQLLARSLKEVTVLAP